VRRCIRVQQRQQQPACPGFGGTGARVQFAGAARLRTATAGPLSCLTACELCCSRCSCCCCYCRCLAPPGYEEAASQGLLAGLNAARRAQKLDTVILPRDSSYMGTLMDDLVTKDLREPYRMLTSRYVCVRQLLVGQPLLGQQPS
jgi:hypothetical protein